MSPREAKDRFSVAADIFDTESGKFPEKIHKVVRSAFPPLADFFSREEEETEEEIGGGDSDGARLCLSRNIPFASATCREGNSVSPAARWNEKLRQTMCLFPRWRDFL